MRILTDFKYLLDFFNRNKLLETLLVIIAFLMCFDKFTLRLIILISAILSLFVSNYKLLKERLSLYKLSLILLWIIPFIQLLVLSSFKLNWHKLETKLSLLIFPLIVITSLNQKKDSIYKVIKYFVYGSFISIIFCLLNSTYQFFVHNNYSAFSYSNLSLFHHPSYYAMFINFSMGALYLRLIYPVKNEEYSKKILLFIFVFSSFIILLASRTGWITNLLIHVLFILFQIKNKSLKKTHVFFGMSIILLFIILNNIPSVNTRSSEVIKHTIHAENQSSYPSSTSTRKKAWETSFELIKQNLIFGLGTGRSSEIMNQLYEKKGYIALKNKTTNSHNEFIQYQLDHGLIGSLVLLFFTAVMLIFSLKDRDFIYSLFLIVIGINFCTESMLETQSGIVFFAFFNTLFFCNWVNKKFSFN